MVQLTISFLAGWMAGVITELFKRLLYWPTLEIKHGRDIGDYEYVVVTTTPNLKFDPDAPKSDDGSIEHWNLMVYRLKVLNEGNDIARNAMGFLVNIEIWDDAAHKFADTGFRDSIPLCWSYLDRHIRQQVDLSRGIAQYLDIFQSLERFGTVELRTVNWPNVYRLKYGARARYRYHVVVTAEGATPRHAYVDLTWRGIWNDFVVNVSTEPD